MFGSGKYVRDPTAGIADIKTSRCPRLCCTAIITSESPACTGAIENIATNKDCACSTTLGTCAQAVLQCQ
jgi:hypothetical protein